MKYIIGCLLLLIFKPSFSQELINKSKVEINTYLKITGGILQKEREFENGDGMINIPYKLLLCSYPDAPKKRKGPYFTAFYLNKDKCFRYEAMYANAEDRMILVTNLKSFKKEDGKELWHSKNGDVIVEINNIYRSAGPGGPPNGPPTGRFTLSAYKTANKYQKHVPAMFKQLDEALKKEADRRKTN